VTLLSINFIGGLAGDSHKFAKTAKTFGIIIDRLYKIAWATRNYSIFAQIVNAGGAFLINFVSTKIRNKF
jgi:hypothetical protein